MPDQRPQEAQGEGGGRGFLKPAVQGLLLFSVSQFLIGKFFGPQQPQEAAGAAGAAGKSAIPGFADRPDISTITNATTVPAYIAPIWKEDSALDLTICISPSLTLPPLSKVSDEYKVLEEKNFAVGDFDDNREIQAKFTVPKDVQNNGTLWAHFYVGLAGRPLDPRAQGYSPETAYYFARPMNQYLPKKKTAKLKNLLDTSDDPEAVGEAPEQAQIASYYHPNITVSVIPNTGVQNYQTMHPAAAQYIQLERTGARDATGQNGWYYPTVFVNTFWQLRSHMTELNSTVETLPLYINLNNLKNWKFSVTTSMDEGMKQNQRQGASGGPMSGSGDGSEFEMVKEILLDTNAYLLATTGIVSILHMIFEGLAFKNDISHWRQKKDTVGTSLRSILGNIFMQAVIFLYLVDNSEGTSWVILSGQGFGIVLEAWKITKTVDVRIRRPSRGSRLSFLPYHIVFEDKHQLSETEQKTKEYDEIAFRWLYIVAVPLLIGYAIYSLLYETHKSWYSYIIETLVGSVYAYGFLMMVPSLYINYRLKSVAHMPGKALMYKFLNTFIDDLFAFTIKMPTLHRLATLRDDVIFFIWLYQGWKYRVDYSRVNEFGQGGVDEDEAAKTEEKKVKEDEKTNASENKTTVAAQASGSSSSGASGRKRK